MGEGNFEIWKQLSASLAAVFTSHTESRVGFIVYSEVVRIVININEDLTPDKVEERILGVEYKRGPTTTDLGIKEALRMFVETERRVRLGKNLVKIVTQFYLAFSNRNPEHIL